MMMLVSLLRFCIFVFFVQSTFANDDVEYSSIEEFDQMPNEFWKNFEHSDLIDAGVLKMLTFNGTANIFVGARNRVCKLDLSLTELNCKNVTEEIEIQPFPSQSYIRQGETRKGFATAKLSYDTCLSYYERMMASNEPVGEIPGNARPYQGWIRFSKDFEDVVCNNTFIRGLERVKLTNGKEMLWVCGTFASFPRSFLMDPVSLEIDEKHPYNVTLPICARWPDEPVTVHFDEDKKNGKQSLFVASGWGLYRPSAQLYNDVSDTPTMLYSDWRMLWNGLHWPTRMAMMLSSDVRFISRVYSTADYLYFFGHEANGQLSYLNSLTHQSHQSFMLRICKNDTGFNYTADADGARVKREREYTTSLEDYWVTRRLAPLFYDETAFSYSHEGWGETYAFPTHHFTSAIKFPFGCYLKRYDGAQSSNNFWGERNIVYFKRLADVSVSFNWTDELTESEASEDTNVFLRQFSGHGKRNIYFNPNTHIYNYLVGAFSSSGFAWTPNSEAGSPAAGAVCQFQLSEWKMDHNLRNRQPEPPEILNRLNKNEDKKFADTYSENIPKNARQYSRSTSQAQKAHPDKNPVTYLTAREEFLALFGSFKDNFYEKGTTWFQGMNPPHRAGIDFMSVPTFNPTGKDFSYLKEAAKCGACLSEDELKKMTNEQFENIMNLSTTAWPTDWFSHLSKYYDAAFHMNPISVAGDNASFVMDNVEFFKMIVLKQNFTDYNEVDASKAPLTYVLLISTEGDVFRVVMCDLVSIPIRRTKCEIRNTDQPYLTIYSMSMHYNDPYKKEFEKLRQIRVSSLLHTWHMTKDSDFGRWEQLNPQAPILKDAVFDEKTKDLFLLTRSRVMRLQVNDEVICGSYRTCIGCASDPLCYWKPTYVRKEKGSESQMEVGVEIGECHPYSTFSKGLQDVFGRGEKCKSLMGKANRWTTQAVEPFAPTVSLTCPKRTLFRGFIKWQWGLNESKLDDIDFDTLRENDKFYRGPEDILVVKRGTDDQTTFFRCVGVGFDDSKETILMQYKILVSDPSPLWNNDYNICTRYENATEESEMFYGKCRCP